MKTTEQARAEFDSWFYAQVVNPTAGDVQRAWDAWQAARQGMEHLLELLEECREFFAHCPSYDGADTNNLDTRCMDAIAAASQGAQQ